MEGHRVVFRRYGGPEVLEVERFDARAPAKGELAVDVAFAGVNYADLIARRGFYKWAPPPRAGAPTCVGFEISGVVSQVGNDVSDFAVGDRIMAVTRFGGYTDRICVEAERARRVPATMTLEQAAALPAVYLTAWHALHEVARVRRGESILIQAVAGGVGLAALQLARHAGMTTYGTASREEKLGFARAHGLHHGIDYAKSDFELEIRALTNGRGVDVVLDSLGGEGLRKGYRCLARGGRVIAIGAAQVAPRARTSPFELLRAGVEIVKGGVFHAFRLIEDNRGVAGVQILLWWDDVAHLRRGIDALLALFEEGVISPVIDTIFPLSRAGEAHTLLDSRRTKGKLLLDCRESAGEI
jgi:NADPH:quinone reductase-like Zn-dependent oxidoreductase